MIFVADPFFVLQQPLARRSPPEPISLQLLTIHGNVVVSAGCRLKFHPQTILIRRRCISTTERALSGWRCTVPLRRQVGFKPWGGRFRFSPPRARCPHFSLPFLSILPSQYLSSRIVHAIYAPALPARTLRARTPCVLLHPNIFLLFSCYQSLTGICQPSFCIPPKNIWSVCALLHTVMYGILFFFCNEAQLYLALPSPEAGSLRAARRAYIYTWLFTSQLVVTQKTVDGTCIAL
jgi:hypothetical protein